ncbi:MAG: hypothetical protein OXP12_03600 [Thaumarchaeota archaeon]|nr:hypothetical protein [Nitrososphaerota archaeon]MDE0266205.1 hypothetical protein [Nitrososphaerota archaeon]MDE0525951.1 hypothetical protein [Nitrososphaerota archaeon]
MPTQATGAFDDQQLDRIYASLSYIVRMQAMTPQYEPHPVLQGEIDAEVAVQMAYGLYSFGNIHPRERADRIVSEYMKRRGRRLASSNRFDDGS